MTFIANTLRLWVRLLGNHLIVGLVPVLLVAGVLVYTARSALEQAVLNTHQQVAQRAAKEVHHFLDQPIASLKVLAQSMNVVRDPWRRQSLLSQIGLELGAVAELCFVDTAGIIQATNVLDVQAPLQRGDRLPPNYLPHARVLWAQVKREEFYASEVVQREGQPSLFNCAALSPGVLESELFGHVKGAFTGAVRGRAGRFAAADGGTLLLDEIGDLETNMQIRLLRVLQEGEFEPVGSTQTRQVDVRLITATHQNLEARIAEGLFREDLYFRINALTIEIPPLRERMSDLPLLCAFFVNRYNRVLD